MSQLPLRVLVEELLVALCKFGQPAVVQSRAVFLTAQQPQKSLEAASDKNGALSWSAGLDAKSRRWPILTSLTFLNGLGGPFEPSKVLRSVVFSNKDS